MQLIFKYNQKKKKNPLKSDAIILVQLNIKERKLLLDFLTHSACTVYSWLELELCVKR